MLYNTFNNNFVDFLKADLQKNFSTNDLDEMFGEMLQLCVDALERARHVLANRNEIDRSEFPKLQKQFEGEIGLLRFSTQIDSTVQNFAKKAFSNAMNNSSTNHGLIWSFKETTRAQKQKGSQNGDIQSHEIPVTRTAPENSGQPTYASKVDRRAEAENREASLNSLDEFPVLKTKPRTQTVYGHKTGNASGYAAAVRLGERKTKEERHSQAEFDLYSQSWPESKAKVDSNAEAQTRAQPQTLTQAQTHAQTQRKPEAKVEADRKLDPLLKPYADKLKLLSPNYRKITQNAIRDILSAYNELKEMGVEGEKLFNKMFYLLWTEHVKPENTMKSGSSVNEVSAVDDTTDERSLTTIIFNIVANEFEYQNEDERYQKAELEHKIEDELSREIAKGIVEDICHGFCAIWCLPVNEDTAQDKSIFNSIIEPLMSDELLAEYKNEELRWKMILEKAEREASRQQSMQESQEMQEPQEMQKPGPALTVQYSLTEKPASTLDMTKPIRLLRRSQASS